MTADEPTDAPPPAAAAPAEAAHTDGETAQPSSDAPGEPRPHRRRRRRRRGPPRPAAIAAEGSEAGDAAPASAEGTGVAVEIATPHVAGENTLRLHARPPRRRRRPSLVRPTLEGGAEAAAAAGSTEGNETGEAAPTTAPGPRLGPDGQPLRRRRRRRRPPQLGGAGESTPASGTEVPAEGSMPAPRDPNRPPRRRHRRPRTDRPGAESTEGAPQEARPDRERRSGASAGRGPRDGDRRRDGPSGRRDRRDGREGRDGRGRGRDDRPKRIERKLYNIDSVVDRGFEDVEEEGGTRRVNWTIVKRTVADQITRKPMSQNYVLQRDGVDSEFPSLGAARSAVNKNIVHPEKLTLSKADHAAQKNSR